MNTRTEGFTGVSTPTREVVVAKNEALTPTERIEFMKFIKTINNLRTLSEIKRNAYQLAQHMNGILLCVKAFQNTPSIDALKVNFPHLNDFQLNAIIEIAEAYSRNFDANDAPVLDKDAFHDLLVSCDLEDTVIGEES